MKTAAKRVSARARNGACREHALILQLRSNRHAAMFELPVLKPIIFIGNARDFHAVDWYRSIKRICRNRTVLFATDLIASEGHAKLVASDDAIVHLWNIDRLLLATQSNLGNVWRNFVKALAAPLQAYRVKRLARAYPHAVYHAHTMYYLVVCWMAGIRYIGTPQGAEIMVRPQKSRIYRFFAVRALRAADHLIVDSVNMQRGIRVLCGKCAEIIQNGIDVAAIERIRKDKAGRVRITSIRALYPMYRIEEILQSRERSAAERPIALFYPYWEAGYRESIGRQLKANDVDLGRLPTKNDLYAVLNSTLLAISIPEMDSSPRSVYEAIFCGCCVAVSRDEWIESLPGCMRSRLHIVNFEEEDWFERAIEHAHAVVAAPYVPSERALDFFDQERSMRFLAERFY